MERLKASADCWLSLAAAPTFAIMAFVTAAFSGGAVIGALGGLIGLGGAEFRLPLLIGLFGIGALEAVSTHRR